jgi:hypothetical protein
MSFHRLVLVGPTAWYCHSWKNSGGLRTRKLDAHEGMK